jgi:predicted MPP superfamily phosphohydrolase
VFRRVWPHLLRAAEVFAVAVIGSAIGAGLAPATTTLVGPFEVDLRVVPSLRPGVVLELPPAGRVEFDTHRAPVSVQAAMGEVDLEGARRLLASRAELDTLERSAPDILRAAATRSAITTSGCALVGAVVLSVLVYRRRVRRTAQVAGALVVVLVITGVATAATFDADRMAQPRFTGLLSKAPYIAGQAESMLARLQSYRVGLADIVQGVTQLYATSGDLPVVSGSTSGDLVTLLHVSDIHLNPISFDLINRLVRQFRVNLVVDTGDITTWGTEVESTTLSRVRESGVPYVFVRGNHDSRRTQRAVAASSNAVVLDGDIAKVAGVVIAGIGDPTFTPDRTTEDVPPAPPALSGTGAVGRSPGSASTSRTPVVAGPPPTPGTPSVPGGTPTAASASRTQQGPGFADSTDPQVRAGNRLAGLIRNWNDQYPESPVTIAAVHEPYAAPPLLGTVPLVLSGHLHHREVNVDKDTGTRLMVEGSTGGAGVTATGVAAADRGEPVPLTATLVYLARRGTRAGQILAYDQVTVGGLGLASISLSRTVVRGPDTATQSGSSLAPTATPPTTPPTAPPNTPPTAPPTPPNTPTTPTTPPTAPTAGVLGVSPLTSRSTRADRLQGFTFIP